jgi:hypothetical protein
MSSDSEISEIAIETTFDKQHMSQFHCEYIRSLFPDCAGGSVTGGGVDLPKLIPSGFDVEIKTTKNKMFLLWDKDMECSDYLLCLDYRILTWFLVETEKIRNVAPVKNKCRGYRTSQIKKLGQYLPKDDEEIKRIVEDLRYGFKYIPKREME